MGDVWFAIPSANPENCRRVLPRWREMGYKTAVLQNFAGGEIPADRVIWMDAYPGWPGSINILCKDVVPKDAPIVVSGGDDMLPDPKHTAQEIADQFRDRFPDLFGVMQPQGDAFEDTTQFCGSPWLGRKWIETMYGGAGPMFPGYRHYFADDELYWVSTCLDVLWVRPDLTQYHDHFRRKNEEKPAYWVQNVERNDRADTQLFIARSSLGFPGHEPRGLEPARVFDAEKFRTQYTGRAQKYWDKYHAPKSEDPAPAKIGAVFDQLAKEGVSRVLVFGAGKHTTRVATALRLPSVEVVGIVDDDPSLRGKRLWNFPVLSTQEAARTGAQAVVLSSDSIEDKLAQAAEPLAKAGMRVVRVYTKATETNSTSAAAGGRGTV